MICVGPVCADTRSHNDMCAILTTLNMAHTKFSPSNGVALQQHVNVAHTGFVLWQPGFPRDQRSVGKQV